MAESAYLPRLRPAEAPGAAGSTEVVQDDDGRMMRRRHFLAGAAALSLAGGPPVRGAVAQEAEGFSRSVVLRACPRAGGGALRLAGAAAARGACEPLGRRLRLASATATTGGSSSIRRPASPSTSSIRASSTTCRSRSSSSTAATSRKVAYDPALFTFGNVPPPEPGTPLEFAGFRALTALNQPDALIPFVIFAGASYFQAISKDQQFGVSARGLAIGTGEAEGEEFPFFRAHWLEPPGGDRMVVHSLLDGPSAAGAYRFTIRPGDVTADRRRGDDLRPRGRSPTSGLAPLTSMFLFDAKDRGEHDDFRLGVHDSDGLAMWNGSDERLWRPLHAPRLLQISAFSDTGPRGFGLIQRERRFTEYEDLAALLPPAPEPLGRADRRLGPRPRRARRDPDQRRGPRQHRRLLAAGGAGRGRQRALAHLSAELGLGRARPRRPAARRPHPARGPAPTAGGASSSTSPARASRAIRASAVQVMTRRTRAPCVDAEIAENPEIGGLRVRFDLDPEGADSVEMRVDLRSGERPIAETWVYRWSR